MKLLGVTKLLFVCAYVLLSACAATPGTISSTEAVAPLNATDDLALKGYDAVAYFADGKPTKGVSNHVYRWQGANWWFASAAHRDQFASDPARYAPQFGSYCSFAVSRGTIADVDPQQWAVVEGKLYLNNNAFAQKLWDQDRVGNIDAGKINWPLLPKLPARTESSRTDN
jgi:YHS domain-containing protein